MFSLAGALVAGRSCANADGAGQPAITESKSNTQKRDKCMDTSQGYGIITPGEDLGHAVHAVRQVRSET